MLIMNCSRQVTGTSKLLQIELGYNAFFTKQESVNVAKIRY